MTLIPAALQPFSDELASWGEPMIALCAKFNWPLFNETSRAFEALVRGFVVDVLKQKPALDAFDRWNSSFDPHAADFPFMRAGDVMLVAVSYLVIVFGGMLLAKLVLPEGGLSRVIAPVQIVHNLVLVLLSLYMMLESINQALRTNYKFFGNEVNPTPAGKGMARILWIFYASKMLEFVDTFIMVARKSFRQITFLHVYHHVTIFVIWWITTQHGPGGDGYFCVILNSGVHVVMYGYYLSVSLGAPLNWIKKSITTMQMTQFVLMMLNATYNIIFPTGYPYYLAVLLEVYMWSLLALFYNFYRKSYSSAAAAKKKKTQ